MQLIYLYIDNYKNIKNQGFSFSPEFICNFEDNILKIDKNPNYVNIFSDNINITALVGKNGSGKSNLLELLFFILKDREYISSSKYILVFKQNNKLYYKFNNLNISNINNVSIVELEQYDSKFENNLILNIEHSLIKYSKDNLWYKKLIKEQEIRDYENFYTKFPYLLNQLNIYKNCIEKIKLNSFFNTFVVNINLFNIERFCNEIQEDKHYVSLLIKKFINDFLQLKNLNPLQKIQKQNIFETRVTGIDSILFYNTIFSFLHFIYINKEYIQKQNSKQLIKKIESIINKANFILDDIFEIVDTIAFDTNDTEFDKHLESSIETFIKFFKYIKLIKTKFSIILDGDTSFQYKYSINENEKIVEIIQNTYYLLYLDEDFISSFFIDYISYDFWYIDKNTTILQYKDLSNGEKTILSIITDIVYYINNHKEAKIVLLDELDETLHPEWKRKLIDILLCIFKKLQRSLHIICTTHSPFILSDIPKENIIFLDNGKNVSNKVDINTFGANIHTLLSHGFFMEDGLMGEFAKNQINEVIKLLNQSKLSKEELDKCENIVSMIGELLIKNQLQKMIDRHKLNYTSNDVYEEIELLKHRIEMLSKQI